MIQVVKDGLDQIESTKTVDPLFIDTVVDFIQVYADRTHHGKEEDIMFAELAQRTLSDHDRQYMNELIEEHVFARKTTKALIDSNDRYRKGDSSAVPDILEKLSTLVKFYPKHIEKEDKTFFPASRSYLSEEEDQNMLEEFWEFDRKMIHEKYNAVVENLET
jgi:hemerythrin-like domain-containing protein